MQSLPVSAGYVPGIRGQSFAELAGVRKDMCRESGDRALQNLPVSAGYVPGILGQGFAELAGVRRMCAGNPGTELCSSPGESHAPPGDRALQNLPVSAGYVPGIRDRALRTSPESLACL